ncbi:alpha/beta fold hydrolase [Tsukamurella sp. 1534]|uniref:alpha/beta fold hydrolase n=1 Tax=Tsukamurella sp. 1534 TaxID=1151061 RepID=UPI0002F7F3E7|nr:alpha/beta fold hydrolase [Tsukamurella sp. 1534]
MTSTSPTLVLVHGAFANSFSFAPLQAALALRGVRSLAVDLPGHGFQATFPAAYQAPQDREALAAAPSSMAGVTLADNAAHLIGVLERAREHGPVTVLAHSRGGITLTAAANARPDLIDRMVYASAWAPVDLDVDAYQTAPEMASFDGAALAGLVAANPADIAALRCDFRTADPASLAAVKKLFLADGTEDEFRTFLTTFQPDENLDVGGAADRARADTWGTVPRTYIRLSEDESMPIAMQDRLIREADALTPGNPSDVRTLRSSHLGWLVHTDPAADLLADIVAG